MTVKLLRKLFTFTLFIFYFLFIFAPSVSAETTTLFFDDVEQGLGDWTTTGDDGVSGSSLWHQTQRDSFSPTHSWYYGKEDTGTYNTGDRNWGHLDSGPINVPSNVENVTLQFEQLLSTENSASPSGTIASDIAKIEVSNDQNSWNTLGTFSSTTGWTAVFTSIPSYYLGDTIYIRFSFDTKDSFANDFEGWYVDDIRVFATVSDDTKPIADPAGPYSVTEEQSLTFDASASFDPDGDSITGYQWRFDYENEPNHYTIIQIPEINHTYTKGGTYTVALEVYANGQWSDTVFTEVNVQEVNDNPVANVGGPYSGVEEDIISFDASLSSDEESSELTYEWDFGDGSETTTTTPMVSHVYNKGGSYTLSLVVNDGSLDSTVDTTEVNIQEIYDPPSVPANLQTTNITSSQIDLTWDPSNDVDGVTQYVIYRDGVEIDSSITNSYQDVLVNQGGSYNYYVTAVDTEDNESDPSNTINVEVPYEPPTSPNNLSTSEITYSHADLVWDASISEVEISEYVIYRDNVEIDRSNTNSYTDAAVSQGDIYSYYVVAVDVNGLESDPSNTINVSIPVDTEPPTPPGNLQASSITDSQVNLSWHESVDNVEVTEYIIYRDGSEIDRISTNTYTDTAVIQGESYNYHLTAVDSRDNESDPSNTISADIPDTTPPSAPSNLNATNVEAEQVDLEWDISTDNVGVTEYIIYRNDLEIGRSFTNTFSDASVADGNGYSYYIIAVDAANNESNPSNSVELVTPQLITTITGTVTYVADGAAIAGAEITLIDPSLNGKHARIATTTTNDSGEYTLTPSAGEYEIEVNANGYEKETIQNVLVADKETIIVNIDLTAASKGNGNGKNK